MLVRANLFEGETAIKTAVEWMEVEFSPGQLTWAQFNKEVIGEGPIETAEAGLSTRQLLSSSIRNTIGDYHCPHKHYRPKKILGELISVKIAARLPTKMFPALFLPRLPKSLACKSVKFVSQSVIITEKILR